MGKLPAVAPSPPEPAALLARCAELGVLSEDSLRTTLPLLHNHESLVLRAVLDAACDRLALEVNARHAFVRVLDRMTHGVTG